MKIDFSLRLIGHLSKEIAAGNGIWALSVADEYAKEHPAVLSALRLLKQRIQHQPQLDARHRATLRAALNRPPHRIRKGRLRGELASLGVK